MTTVVVHSWLWSLRNGEGVEVVTLQDFSLAPPDPDALGMPTGMTAVILADSIRVTRVTVPHGSSVRETPIGPRLVRRNRLEIANASTVLIKALRGIEGYALAPIEPAPTAEGVAP